MTIHVKNIQEFLSSLVQFDIIQRSDEGKACELHISSKDFKFEFHKTLFDIGGVIRIVKRISDDVLFYNGDMVELDQVGSVCIVSFNDNCIHCMVVDMDQKEHMVEINDLIHLAQNVTISHNYTEEALGTYICVEIVKHGSEHTKEPNKLLAQ